MVRKRLSDMLREEAQKPTETDINVAPTAQPKPAAKSRPSTTGSRTVAKSPSSTASKDTADEDTAAKDETTAIVLEVTRLKAELTATAKQTSELNQQVIDLKAELENQVTAAKTLQTTLKKAEQHGQQLATELTEAKQTILNLVEVNSQLKQDLSAKQAAAIRETIPREIAPLPKKSLPETPTAAPTEIKKNALVSTTLSQQELLQRQKKSLAHPVFPAGNSPGHLSEQDLGWVD